MAEKIWLLAGATSFSDVAPDFQPGLTLTPVHPPGIHARGHKPRPLQRIIFPRPPFNFQNFCSFSDPPSPAPPSPAHSSFSDRPFASSSFFSNRSPPLSPSPALSAPAHSFSRSKSPFSSSFSDRPFASSFFFSDRLPPSSPSSTLQNLLLPLTLSPAQITVQLLLLRPTVRLLLLLLRPFPSRFSFSNPSKSLSPTASLSFRPLLPLSLLMALDLAARQGACLGR